MTTELEQEFFKVFGIEPIEYRKNVPCLNFLSSGICNITDERCNPSKCNEYRPDKTSRLWRDFMEVYPEITDRKLLEMICILNETSCEALLSENIEDLKNEILETCIRVYNTPIITSDGDEYENNAIYDKIQQLFKEEK